MDTSIATQKIVEATRNVQKAAHLIAKRQRQLNEARDAMNDAVIAQAETTRSITEALGQQA